MSRRFCIAIVFALLLVSMSQLQVGVIDQSETINSNSTSFSISEYNETMSIRSNSDFSNYGWSGDGSVTNPYTLDGISLHTGISPSIEIRNTDAYFVLNNSVLTTYYSTDEDGIINLVNVANGIISNCKLSEYYYFDGIGIFGNQVSNTAIMDSWIIGDQGVILEESTNCTISGNRITAKTSHFNAHGINLVSSNQMMVSNNTVLYKTEGIHLMATDNSILINNSIFGCHVGLGFDYQEGYVNQSEDNVVYNNSLGWSEYFNAFDYGLRNRWDDNISIGNAYSDYNETGDYEIRGDSNTVDRYPRMLIDDTFGPRINHYFPYYGIDYVEPGPVNYTIYADVTDISGVDKVLLIFNGTEYVMQRSTDESLPNRFFTVFPYRGLYEGSIYFHYTFIANDTLGNYFETREHHGYIAVWLDTNPPIWSPNIPTFPVSAPFVIIIIASVVIVGSCVLYIDRRWIDEKMRYVNEHSES